MSRTFSEFVEDVVARIGGYDPRAERAQQKFAATVIHLGSVAVVSTCTAALLWRVGALKRVLPAPVRNAVQDVADKIAAHTEPPKITRMNATAATHLLTVYKKTATAFAVSFAGSWCFFKMPYFPMPLAMAGTAIPAFITTALPAEYVNPNSRRVLNTLCAFCCGYSFGPINWVAYDCTIFGGVSVLSSAAGFSTAAMITRGKVSFFVVSQLLSASISVVGSHLVMHTTLGFDKASTRTQNSMATANVNGILAVQVVSNLFLAALHSLPTLMHFEERERRHAEFKRQNNIDENEVVSLPDDEERNSDQEAMIIFGSVAYATWTAFRYTVAGIVRALTSKKSDSAASGRLGTAARAAGHRNTAALQEEMRKAAKTHDKLALVSDFAASLFALYVYVRVVGYFQQTATVGRSLDSARALFARLSPVVVIA